MSKKKKMVGQEKVTLGKWLIDHTNTDGYRAGKITRMKHPEVDQNMIDAIGRRELLEQAAQLQMEGLIKPEWTDMKTDIKQIHFSVDKMPQLCKRERITEPKEELQRIKERVENWKSRTDCSWLIDYYQKLLGSLEQGRILEAVTDETMFHILNAIAELKEDVWKRKFSEKELGDSKKFKEIYENRVITILRKESPKSDEAMTNDEILAQHGIMTYSQTLDIKGRLICVLLGQSDSENIDTSNWIYGCILNAQTLMYYEPKELSGIKKIITIENKANYESMLYQYDILYIYTHGFFSPKEQTFLKKLNSMVGEEVEFYHWSDMDFGGIRIFNHIKKNIFPKAIPLHMGRKDYEAAMASGAGIDVSKEKLGKIREIEAGMLGELKECILEYEKEIEQESLLE